LLETRKELEGKQAIKNKELRDKYDAVRQLLTSDWKCLLDDVDRKDKNLIEIYKLFKYLMSFEYYS